MLTQNWLVGLAYANSDIVYTKKLAYANWEYRLALANWEVELAETNWDVELATANK